ncbi:MAG: DUF3313 family protein [Gammaproteobacteria bacterium]
MSCPSVCCSPKILNVVDRLSRPAGAHRIFSTLLGALVIAGASVWAPLASAEAASAEVAHAGFLTDYNRLDKAGRPRKSFLVYLAPNAEQRAVHAIALTPAVIAPAGATFEDLSANDVAALITRLDSRLRAEFSQKARLADGAGSADVQLQVALTQIGAEEKGRSLVDLVPVRLVTGTVKNAVQGKELTAFATFESRVIDATTGAVLRERIDHIVGDEIGRSGDADTRLSAEAVIPAIDEWVKRIVKATAPELE